MGIEFVLSIHVIFVFARRPDLPQDLKPAGTSHIQIDDDESRIRRSRLCRHIRPFARQRDRIAIGFRLSAGLRKMEFVSCDFTLSLDHERPHHIPDIPCAPFSCLVHCNDHPPCVDGRRPPFSRFLGFYSRDRPHLDSCVLLHRIKEPFLRDPSACNLVHSSIRPHENERRHVARSHTF